MVRIRGGPSYEAVKQSPQGADSKGGAKPEAPSLGAKRRATSGGRQAGGAKSGAPSQGRQTGGSKLEATS